MNIKKLILLGILLNRFFDSGNEHLVFAEQEVHLEDKNSTNNWEMDFFDGDDVRIVGNESVTIVRKAENVQGLAWRYPWGAEKKIIFDGIKNLNYDITTQQNGGMATGLSSQAQIAAADTNFDIKIEFINSDLLGRGYLYGILAGSSVNAGITANTEAFNQNQYSTVEVNNLTLDQKVTGQDFSFLNSGLRAIQGAADESGAGPAGRVIVNGNLEISLTNGTQEGIYASGQGEGELAKRSSVILKGNSKISLNDGRGTNNSAIKLGKTRPVGSGGGYLESHGNMDIDMGTSKGTAIKLMETGSELKADYATSGTTAVGNNVILSIGENDQGKASISEGIQASFHNAQFSTRSNTDSLIKVFKDQKAVNLSFSGENTQLATSEDSTSYLLEVEKNSQVEFTLANGMMQGLTKNDSEGESKIFLKDQAIWKLQEQKANGNLSSSFSELNLDHALLDASAGDFILQGNVHNGGLVSLSDKESFSPNTLTIEGDYTSVDNKGKLQLSGVLNGDDNSPIDQLVIQGSASGTTKVAVNNIGGLGEKTVNGIQIITVTEENKNGNQTFINEGRIVSGAYDYFVTLKEDNNWYLTNELSEKSLTIRPEGGAYLGNAVAANQMFQISLHDRMGEVGFSSWDTDKKGNDRGNVWARVDKRKSFINEKSGQIELRQDYDVIQVGVDLLHKKKANRTYLFGIMGGYGDAKTNSRGSLYTAEGKIHGYGFGVYGTIYDEHADKSGKYIDSWLLWNTFDGEVNGQGLQAEKYDLDGLTASIEVGYDQLARQHQTNANHNLWLKWQGQLTYQGVKADGHRESNGTYVGENDTNFQTRLGVRLYKKMRNNEGKWSQPFAELNWYHNTSTYDITMDGDRNFATRGARNIAELKLGYEGQVGKNLQLWGHLFGAVGSESYHSYGLRFGAKYMF